MIPKKIHQTVACMLSNPTYDIIARNINFLKSNNPTWEHYLYTDSDVQQFIEANYDKTIVDSYNSINPEYGAARADLFRYLCLYKLGGVYLDIKSSASMPLDSVLQDDDELILSHWSKESFVKHCSSKLPTNFGGRGEYQQWNIICKPEHPLLWTVIQNVIHNISCYDIKKDGVGHLGVLNLTGPRAYTKIIMPLIHEHKHRLVNIDELGFRYSIFPAATHSALFKIRYSTLRSPIILKNNIQG